MTTCYVVSCFSGRTGLRDNAMISFLWMKEPRWDTPGHKAFQGDIYSACRHKNYRKVKIEMLFTYTVWFAVHLQLQEQRPVACSRESLPETLKFLQVNQPCFSFWAEENRKGVLK